MNKAGAQNEHRYIGSVFTILVPVKKNIFLHMYVDVFNSGGETEVAFGYGMWKKTF